MLVDILVNTTICFSNTNFENITINKTVTALVNNIILWTSVEVKIKKA